MTPSTSSGINQRHIIAVTALIAGLVALYLYLWKLGLMGALSCSSGHGCEMVQTSSYGMFMGIIVALIGVVGYSLILIVSLVGTTEKFQNDPRITIALMCLIYPAILFTLRLKYYEWIVMKTFCIWCAESAITITLHGFLVYSDWKRVKNASR